MGVAQSTDYPLPLVLDVNTRPQVRELQKFIESAAPSVLVLQGKWGRGKTHLWQSLLRASAKFGMEKYCYVSLFGINSLSDLKRTLFERSIPSSQAHKKDFDQSFNVETLKDFWERNPIRKSAGFFSRISNPWTGSLGDQWSSVAYGMLKSHLICLDDLERRGDGLPLKDVLGVISQLAVEKGCSVLVISNVEQLSAPDQVVWAEHREKVVDRTITYDPEAGPAIRAAFGEPSDDYRREAIRVLESVKSSNLRIASRVISNVDAALSEAGRALHEGAKRSIAKSVALLTYCHEGRADGAPPVSRALGHGRWSGVAALLGQDGRSSEEKVWDSVLDELSYYADQIDHCLASYIANGYFSSNYADLSIELNRKHCAEDVAAGYSAAWEEFHDGYGGDAAEFSQKFYEATLASTSFESALNIDSSICLLRDLGKDDWANECGLAWLTHRLPLAGVKYRISELELFRPIRDKWFRQRIEDARAEAQSAVTLGEAMSSIASRTDDQEIAYDTVAGSTVDQLGEWLLESRGSELRNAVKGILDPYPAKSAGQAKAKLVAALKALAERNPLDKIRVARLNLDDGD